MKVSRLMLEGHNTLNVFIIKAKRLLQKKRFSIKEGKMVSLCFMNKNISYDINVKINYKYFTSCGY